MSFVQIIEYETDKPDEVMKLGDSQMRENAGHQPFTRLTMTQDRDMPNHYETIVEFDSYEAAMANSRDPSTNEFAKKMAALCTKPPRYHNLDVKTSMPQ